MDTCPSCHSCGMPFEKASDHALGDPKQIYCMHCTDEKGQLKAYEDILSGYASYLVHSQGLALAAATNIARNALSQMPAWKDRPRVNLYFLIHKAQRAHLFDLSAKIGRADFSDAMEANVIQQELRDMIQHLREHAINETTFVHPLFEEVGNQVDSIDEGHEDLEKELDKLQAMLNTKQWNQLYSALNRFIALYLTHLDEEESLQEEVLWKHFDDARLDAALTAFKKSRSPGQMMEDIKFMIPAMSIPELTKMFREIKAHAPVAAFQIVCKIAEGNLDPIRWSKLHQQI